MDNSTLLNSPWAITPEALRQISQFDLSKLEDPVKGFQAEDSAMSYKQRMSEFMKQFEEQLMVTDDGIGTIDISGPIMPNPGPVERFYFGACDSVRVANLIQAAANSPEIEQLVLLINSPGGMVVGTPEVGNAVKAFNETGKTSHAFADTLMASAAYWIGSQATHLHSTESALVGSVGVIRPHVDLSEAYGKAGIKVEIFRAGKHKVAGAMATSISDEQREQIQAGVDACHEDFKAAVTTVRDIDDEHMQGQVFYGKDAIAIGMVDSIVANASQVFKTAHSASRDEGNQMSVDKKEGVIMPTKDKADSKGSDQAEEVTLESAQADLETANSRVSELEKASEDQDSRISDLTVERDAANDKVEDLEAQLSEANTKAEDAEKQFAELKDSFDEKVKVEAEKIAEDLAEEKAAKIAADSGTDPAPVGAGADGSDDEFESMSESELWAHCSKIEDAQEKRAFYVKHIQNR